MNADCFRTVKFEVAEPHVFLCKFLEMVYSIASRFHIIRLVFDLDQHVSLMLEAWPRPMRAFT